LDIKAFIRELLFGYDCVIVPGFGGFIGNYSPARIDRSTGTFKPPLRQITFNRNLDHNDGLLVGKISMSTGLHYGDSRKVVEDFVRDIRNRLARGERVVFDHLGSFTLNHEKSIQFDPESNINYYLGAYGLESFHLSHHKGYDVRKRVGRHIDRDPVRGTSLRKNLVRAAIMIPIVALLVIVPLKDQYNRKSGVESVTLNPLVTAEFENNRNAIDSDLITITPVSEGTSVNNTSDIITAGPVPATVQAAPAITPDVAEETAYYVITGSFKSEENALSHMEMLREEGFDPEIIKATNGFFRVNAMKCSDIETAVSKKDSLSRKFPGVWITRKKPI
jgi:nucleoid DNA-binding protein